MSGDPTLRREFPLRIRKIFKKSFWRILLTVIFGFIGSVMLYQFAQSSERGSTFFLIWLGLLLLFIAWSPIYELLYLVNYFYDMDDRYVIIRKGILVKREMTLPFRKITDVYVDQDFLDFVLGLYDVHISTPTAESGRFAHIDGVDRGSAMALKKMILERVNQVGTESLRKGEGRSS